MFVEGNARIGPKGFLLPGLVYPPIGLRVNRKHSLANGLTMCLVAAGGTNLIDLATPRWASSSATAMRSRGITEQDFAFVADDLNFTGAFSVACVLNVPNTAPGSPGTRIFSRFHYVSESVNQGWELDLASTSSRYAMALYNNNASAAYAQFSSNNTVIAGYNVVGHTADGTTRRFYCNGRIDVTSTSLGQSCASASGINVDQSRTSTTAANAPETYMACAWSRALSTFEMLQFHSDPMCFLEAVAGIEVLNFNNGSVIATGSVGQVIFMPTQALTGLVGPGGQVAQTLLRPSQALIGGTSVPSDEFFSWRTD